MPSALNLPFVQSEEFTARRFSAYWARGKAGLATGIGFSSVFPTP